MDVESGEHAGGGRGIARADFARAALIPQFEDRFPVPDAASGGARPLNDERRTVPDQVMSKIQFRWFPGTTTCFQRINMTGTRATNRTARHLPLRNEFQRQQQRLSPVRVESRQKGDTPFAVKWVCGPIVLLDSARGRGAIGVR